MSNLEILGPKTEDSEETLTPEERQLLTKCEADIASDKEQARAGYDRQLLKQPDTLDGKIHDAFPDPK